MRKIRDISIYGDIESAVVCDRTKTLRITSDWSEKNDRATCFLGLSVYPIILFNRARSRDMETEVVLSDSQLAETLELHNMLFTNASEYKADLLTYCSGSFLVFKGMFDVHPHNEEYAMVLDLDSRKLKYLDMDDPLVGECMLAHRLIGS